MEHLESKNILSHTGSQIPDIVVADTTVQEKTRSTLPRVIVLSPDAETFLGPEDLVDDQVIFCVGGIVDKTVHKNETSDFARNHLFETRRLPLHLCIAKQQHPVLNVNTVVEIIAEMKFLDLPEGKVSQERLMCEWGKIMERHCPTRRAGKLGVDRFSRRERRYGTNKE